MKVLFLCTGNSCRSQMAEGFARGLWPDGLEVSSAGIEKHGLNPNAMRVMAEAGYSIDSQKSQSLDDLPDLAFDLVITVCGHAHETCAMFPGEARVVHQGFDDPPKLAAGLPEDEALVHYRRVRDEIREAVAKMPEAYGLLRAP
ncbi:MAG: arsenate reductase ArsC [Pseudomonadota bacterium]